MVFKKRKTAWHYLLYALGEILLIIIGILIAVKINESVKQAEVAELRCTYLNELLYTFDYDIEDVEGNLRALDKWIPKIRSVFDGLQYDSLATVDSLHEKLGTVGNFIFFGQRSKTKIEELKFSPVNLIENRDLKNRILLYEDDKVSFIRLIERKYELIGEDLRQYYARNFRGFSYGPAVPLDIEVVAEDPYYFSLVLERLRMNYNLEDHYEALNDEQKAIRGLILEEIEKTCRD
ncbi:MAG: hypothetical protein AAF433_08365 [Bacteroidota bacterium]